jgi:hypothetical protein
VAKLHDERIAKTLVGPDKRGLAAGSTTLSCLRSAV